MRIRVGFTVALAIITLLLTLDEGSPSGQQRVDGMVSSPEVIMASGNYVMEYTQMDNGQDCFELADGKAVFFRCDESSTGSRWESPGSWTVTEIVSGDLNRDGNADYGLLVWRPFEPWPIDAFLPSGGRIADHHNQDGMSCHFILIGWDGNKYRELWAGSALAQPISHLQAADVDQDGYQELIGIEGKYDAGETGDLTVWKWQGFGFTLSERIEGNFSSYSVSEFTNRIVLLPGS